MPLRLIGESVAKNYIYFWISKGFMNGFDPFPSNDTVIVGEGKDIGMVPEGTPGRSRRPWTCAA